MSNAITKQLEDLQRRIFVHNRLQEDIDGTGYEFMEPRGSRLYFAEADGRYSIVFHGCGNDDSPGVPAVESEDDEDTNFAFTALLDLLSDPQVAARIVHLEFSGDDEGANGIGEWDFTRLVNAGTPLPQLRFFSVRLTDPGDHNVSVIDHEISASGDMVTRLAALMPNIESLSLPSSPNRDFFGLALPKLYDLRLQDPWPDSVQFISNFAESAGFPSMTGFDYQDLSNPYGSLGKEPNPSVSVDVYMQLFQSRALDPVQHFKLRTSSLNDEQLLLLQAIRPNLGLLHIPTPATRYVSHLAEERDRRG
jgi:hypothetical protein